MPAHIRLGLRALARRPDLAARGGARVVRMLERHPNALTRVATFGATPADRRLLADGEMGETAIESFLAAAAGGVQGMIEDYVTCCTAWGFDLREVLGEVHLWHGERDRFVPVEHARALAAALPRCRAQFDAAGRPLLLPPARGRGAGRAGGRRSAAEGPRRSRHDLVLRHAAQALGEVPAMAEGIGELHPRCLPQNVSARSCPTVAPACTARAHAASTSSTFSCSTVAVPPMVSGETMPASGNSLATWTTASPSCISTTITVPPGSGMRLRSLRAEGLRVPVHGGRRIGHDEVDAELHAAQARARGRPRLVRLSAARPA